jgi:GNAT superfamily N-acetyltransferase
MTIDVRPVDRYEGQLLREIRLRALADAPDAFVARWETEAAEPREAWDERAAKSEAGAVSIVFVAMDKNAARGMAGGFRSTDDTSAVTLWGMWVEPNLRRHGVGERLVNAIRGWASARGAARIELCVLDGADAAASLYRGLGFVTTDHRRGVDRDSGLRQVAMVLVL